jgi:regulator of nucleoside diphosphate kinase
VKEIIFVTREDLRRLQMLIETSRVTQGHSQQSLDTLEGELDRAVVMDPGKIPRDVVTVHSEVRLRDVKSHKEYLHRLVLPNEAGAIPNALSVMAPAGIALLGSRPGDRIKCRAPKGVRKLEVLEVLSHPEPAEEHDRNLLSLAACDFPV